MTNFPLIPITIEQVLSIIKSLERYQDDCIDGKVLACLVRMAYFRGLKQHELVRMKIGAVVDKNGQVSTQVEVGGSHVRLQSTLRRLLANYLDYLKGSRCYTVSKSTPLFPSKRRSKGSLRAYTNRKLNRHLRKASGRKVHLEDVRKSGIGQVYAAAESLGRSRAVCLKKTASFARLTEDHTEKLLRGRVNPPGKR